MSLLSWLSVCYPLGRRVARLSRRCLNLLLQRYKMQRQKVTILLETTIDPAHLLDIAIEIARQMQNEIESYDERVEINTDEIAVSSD